MPGVAAILALWAGVAGWYYLFYSKSARRLAPVEDPATNDRRHRLRRANGAVLLAVGGLFYAGFTVDPHRRPGWYVVVWSAVLLLLGVLLVLVLLDMRLTARLRRRRAAPGSRPEP